MDEFISTSITSINTEGLWSTIGACVPIIALSVLFGLGVFFILRTLYKLVRTRFGI